MTHLHLDLAVEQKKYYLNDYMGALADFNKQIELQPNSPYAYYNRGSAKSNLNDEYGAISDYTKAIELKPDYSMAWNNKVGQNTN